MSGYAAFYARESQQVLRVCFLATLDAEAAADATQETLARAWKHWSKIEDSNPSAWARTLALGLCRSRWRRRARQARLLPKKYVLDGVPEVIPHVELHAGLQELPVRQREAITLVAFDGRSIADCANVMKLSEGVVESHLTRARDRLGRVITSGEEPGVSGVKERLSVIAEAGVWHVELRRPDGAGAPRHRRVSGFAAAGASLLVVAIVAAVIAIFVSGSS